ncbi:C40 family peptidase [bacterium]|nr:C40 family peptidase [bacterium]
MRLLSVAVILLALAGSAYGQTTKSGISEISVVRVIRENAPLYLKANGASEIIRTATIGEEFPNIDFILGFYLLKDEVTGSFLYLDPLDAVLTKDIVDLPEPQAYIRAPDEDWYWLDTSFFIIEDESSDALYSGRYNPNLTYMPMANPEQLISTAMKYKGVRYKWGGESMSGIDCSGLVLKCLNAQGFRIAHKASIQARYGRYIPYDCLRSGDVLFFTDKKQNQIGHTGIYLGNGKFIHAASSLGKVGISSLSEDYYRNHLILARRY